MSPRLKWKRARLANIDKVLATNGAHSAPARYDLVDEAGHAVATVRFSAGAWAWETEAGGRGKNVALMQAKTAAKAAIRGRAR